MDQLPAQAQSHLLAEEAALALKCDQFWMPESHHQLQPILTNSISTIQPRLQPLVELLMELLHPLQLWLPPRLLRWRESRGWRGFMNELLQLDQSAYVNGRMRLQHKRSRLLMRTERAWMISIIADHPLHLTSLSVAAHRSLVGPRTNEGPRISAGLKISVELKNSVGLRISVAQMRATIHPRLLIILNFILFHSNCRQCNRQPHRSTRICRHHQRHLRSIPWRIVERN
jgi:hypothetical protein